MAGAPGKKKVKLAYSYIRFSRAHQIEGDSLRRQSKATAEYCERHKLTLDESLNLRDLGVSAYRGKNAKQGALSRFIAACEAGIVPRGSALILESLDRLSRQSPRKTVRLLTELLDDYGIEIHLTQAGKVFKPENEDGVDLIFAVALAMRAHEESETKSKRLKEAFEQKRKKAAAGNDYVSKTLPWWLTWDEAEENIICPDDRREILERIFREVADGASPLAVARMLNDEGKPTWRPKAKVWLDSRVRDTINSDAPLGTIESTKKTKLLGRKWELAGYYPAVIDPAVAADARATIRQNRKRLAGRKPRQETVPNLLKAIARYKDMWCRFSVRRNNTGWNGYYEALDDNRRVPWAISANQLEPILLVSIADLSPDNLKAPNTGNAETAMLRAEVQNLENALSNINMAVEAGSTTMIPRLLEVEKEIAVAREQLVTAEAADGISVDTHALTSLVSYSIPDLKDPVIRPEIAATLRRLVARVQLGSNLDDLPADADHNILTLEDGDTILEDTREDPTGSRGKHPLAILVQFHGGGQLAIQRGTAGVPAGEILITRIFRAGDAIIN